MYYDVLDSGNKINISRDVMTRRKSRVFFFYYFRSGKDPDRNAHVCDKKIFKKINSLTGCITYNMYLCRSYIV